MGQSQVYSRGNAMDAWRSAQSANALHQRTMQDDADEQWRIIRSKGWSTSQMQGVADMLNRRHQMSGINDCDYCGTTGVVDKCANCVAS